MSRRQPSPFGIERYGEPISAAPIRLLDTGITYRRPVPGIVPEIEEREAARFNGYTWKEWLDLPRQERVDGLAYFRIQKQIDMHRGDAQSKEQERQTRRARKK